MKPILPQTSSRAKRCWHMEGAAHLTSGRTYSAQDECKEEKGTFRMRFFCPSLDDGFKRRKNSPWAC